MALQTGRGHLRCFVIGIGRAVVVSQVTAYTCCGQTVVLPARVTLVTAGLNMLAGQREAGVVVVKDRFPVGRCVTRLACRREVRRFVIGIGCAIIIRQVATHARRRQTFKDAADMTLLTRRLHMLSG